MKKNRTYLVFVLVAAVACLRATPVAAQAGPEQTQQLLKTVEGTVKAIGESRAQLQKTVATYNSITEMTAKDLKSAYKDLGKDVAESEKKVADGRPKVDEMNTAAASYFSAWKASAAAISDPGLRKRSEERLAAARTRHSAIHAAGQQAADLYATFTKTLRDHVTFLGHDLNPGAVANLKPDAAKLNKKADELLASIDATVATANSNISALQPQ